MVGPNLAMKEMWLQLLEKARSTPTASTPSPKKTEEQKAAVAAVSSAAKQRRKVRASSARDAMALKRAERQATRVIKLGPQ